MTEPVSLKLPSGNAATLEQVKALTKEELAQEIRAREDLQDQCIGTLYRDILANEIAHIEWLANLVDGVPKPEWKTVYKIDRGGFGVGPQVYGLEIRVCTNRKMSERDNRAIRQASRELLEALDLESTRLDTGTEAAKNQQLKQFKDAFEKAGLAGIFVEEIPNGYEKELLAHPWLIITTKFGHFKVGWRRSVINLDWTRTTIKEEPEQIEVFAGWKARTTMGTVEGCPTGGYLHVGGGYDGLAACLKTLVKHAEKTK